MTRTVYLVRRENEDRVRAVFTSWMRADRFALRCAQRDDTHYVVDGYTLDPDTDDLIAAARGREEPAEGGVAETPPALPHPQTPPDAA